MNWRIDRTYIENIRRTGCYTEPALDRRALFDAYALPYDRKAENAVITGCRVIASQPQILAALARFFDRHGFSYTFLSQEYCCGNMLYRSAIQARDEDAMQICRGYSDEFTRMTLASARRCGATRLVIYCSPCYPIYKQALANEEIVFYPAAIDEVLEPQAFSQRIDYYAGCYKLHRKLSSAPMDLSSTHRVLNKIEGLKVNRIKAPACCYSPKGLAHMMTSIETDTLVHICTGCYAKARANIPAERKVDVMMLPEFLEKVVR